MINLGNYKQVTASYIHIYTFTVWCVVFVYPPTFRGALCSIAIKDIKKRKKVFVRQKSLMPPI